ncbi:Ribosomal RNA-processing protein 7-like protein [Auxenochlorella protothecoides]|uniref:Ribosomal RNA-processing protein 7-like protein n=1 Tax=Auxenochlorella protothecoides TaxID=3075 RepID=A0A087SPJ6_AUXPR|nr:Ribosomal RNA-processing protein 7-like protein [Auxenochlorella protothecoides]KFM27650.1 Ribosomal RNA-processing protein 7-like protein [Auxenochlorella protothecoides]RMZ54315.1 hypothetical protein APUTEX25_001473 [Auxenochlorella protothecoides]|eukprot:RMZ54315.1 hypothetical protein APUTEX25_001473 [Auxenochlorella protothecoides]
MTSEVAAGPRRAPIRVIVREGSSIVRHLDCKVDPGKTNKPQNLTVSVAGIPADLTEGGLLELFGRFGEVQRIALHGTRTSAAVLYTSVDGPRKIWKQRANEEPIMLHQALPETPFGLKGWVEEHKAGRPGNAKLQAQLDAWTEAFEAAEEAKAAAARAAAQADDGWTLVQRHKGRKKGVDEAGVVGGGVAASAASSAARRANAEVHANFYRSQLRASRQSEILTLRDKFEEDKKRMAALRATRRFQPY